MLSPLEHPARQGVVGVFDAAGFPAYAIVADGFPESLDESFKPLQIGFGGSADRFEDWRRKPLPVIDSLLPTDIRDELVAAGFPPSAIDRDPESGDGFFLRGEATTGQAVHTASDIPISSYSKRSDAWQDFVGLMDNTDVFFKIVGATIRNGR